MICIIGHLADVILLVQILQTGIHRLSAVMRRPRHLIHNQCKQHNCSCGLRVEMYILLVQYHQKSQRAAPPDSDIDASDPVSAGIEQIEEQASQQEDLQQYTRNTLCTVTSVQNHKYQDKEVDQKHLVSEKPVRIQSEKILHQLFVDLSLLLKLRDLLHHLDRHFIRVIEIPPLVQRPGILIDTKLLIFRLMPVVRRKIIIEQVGTCGGVFLVCCPPGTALHLEGVVFLRCCNQQDYRDNRKHIHPQAAKPSSLWFLPADPQNQEKCAGCGRNRCGERLLRPDQVPHQDHQTSDHDSRNLCASIPDTVIDQENPCRTRTGSDLGEIHSCVAFIPEICKQDA